MIRLTLLSLLFSLNAYATIELAIPDRFSQTEISKIEKGETLVRSLSVTQNGYKISAKAFLSYLPEQFLEVMQDYERYPEFMQVSGSSGSIDLEDRILSGKILNSNIDPLTRLGELEYELEVFVKLSFVGFSIQEYQFTGQFSAQYGQDIDGTIIVNSRLINPTEEISDKLKSLSHYWEVYPTQQGVYLYYENSVTFAKPLTEPEWYDFVKPSLAEQKRIIKETISQKVRKVIENYRDELNRTES
ncbi:MAG: hypothetical protein A3F16_04790 [Deltaproteobacteria bacterium RIFCSPHIGHO2_12_FULL_43_9]|nr:MAG: hypothetical protein A3F16_04790 [Deltaproteobacteria bacterium RIFCSPHIGHO2_12_FULL_43_9]